MFRLPGWEKVKRAMIQTHKTTSDELFQGLIHTWESRLVPPSWTVQENGTTAATSFFQTCSKTGLRRGRKLRADLKQNPLVIKIWLAGWLWQTSEALNWRTRSRFFFGMLIQACAVSGSKEPCKCKWSQKMSLWNKYQVCLWFSLLWCLLPIKR